MKQFFRSIKRFFRGMTKRMRAVFCLSLVLVLSLAAFGVYSLAKPEEQTKAGGNQLMFEKAERGAIESVLLHHKNGAEYSVKRYHDVTEDALGNPVEVSGFLLSDGERDYGHLTLNETALSELIVGTGSHYIVDTVLTAPDPSDPDYAQKMAQYKEKLAEFGLGEGAPYYELTTVLGAKYRVYYGVKSATGGSYYVRLEGRDTVYITAGAEIGDLLAAESPVSLLDASLFLPSNNEYAYAYPKLFRITDFTRYEREDFPDMIVKGNMRVGFTCMGEDGELYKASCDLTLEQHSDFKVLLGKQVGLYGEGELVFEASTPDYTDRKEDGTYGSAVMTYDVRSIDYVEVEEVRVSIRFVNPSERDMANRYSIYGFTMESASHYLPSTDVFMTVTENTYKATGKVVALGLNTASIEKYGLYRHTVEFDVPYFSDDMYVLDADGNQTEDLAPAGYLPGYIYVSDVTENGTRYVGSMLYDIVCEVDAVAFNYLDLPFIEFTEPYMVNAAIMDVTDLWMDWNYSTSEAWLSAFADLSISFGTEQDYQGNAYSVIKEVLASHDKNGASANTAIAKDIYTQFFYRLYYIKYKGGHSLGEEELAALLADESKTVLTLGIRLSDGSEELYRFVPISHDRVLVVLEHGGKTNEKLVIYGTALKDLARAYVNMMNGVAFDHEDRY